MSVDQRPSCQLASPTNRLVSQLPSSDRALLLAACERLSLKAGTVLDDKTDIACLPERAVMSLVDDKGIEVSLIGPEGMSGWSLLMTRSVQRVHLTAACSGDVLTLPVKALTDLCRRSAPIRDMALRSVEVFAAQMLATIGASARHSTRARIARRLLMLHDRTGEDAFEAKHAQIAEALGVRRASVTDALHLLEGERALRCCRNQITVVNRTALEASAGAAYGPAERIDLR